MTSKLKKIWGIIFLLKIPPVGTPGILKFKIAEKMKHPTVVVASSE